MGPASYVTCRITSGPHRPSLTLVTDLSSDTCLSGATDVKAVAKLVTACPNARLFFLPSLHAKVYIADERAAVVTSANFTDSGWLRNIEYGVGTHDPEKIREIRRNIADFSLLGSVVDAEQVQRLAIEVTDLRELRRRAERSIRGTLRRELARRMELHQEQVLRIRSAGRTAHAIFADTILFLLRHGPMSTRDMNPAIQRIHPDLCDDTIDRVIDGRHFGKKWKHAVRTSQVTLRRQGAIVLRDGLWTIA
jgi:hypothetical protein